MSSWYGTLLAAGGCMWVVRGLPAEPRQVAVQRICKGVCWGHRQTALCTRLHKALPMWSSRCLAQWGSVFCVERMAWPSAWGSPSGRLSLFFNQGALGAWIDLLILLFFFFSNLSLKPWFSALATQLTYLEFFLSYRWSSTPEGYPSVSFLRDIMTSQPPRKIFAGQNFLITGSFLLFCMANMPAFATWLWLLWDPIIPVASGSSSWLENPLQSHCNLSHI